MYLDSVDNDDLNQQLHNTEYLNDLRQQMIKFALLQLSSFQQAELNIFCIRSIFASSARNSCHVGILKSRSNNVGFTPCC